MRTLKVQELELQATVERLHLIWPVERLATIYLALRGYERAQRHVMVEQAELYHFDLSMTFYEFVRSNWLPIYEEVLR